jgi:hypothetical protein
VALGAGAVAFVLGAWVGLRASLQRLCGISIAGQCILSIVWFRSVYSAWPLAAVWVAILAIHILNVVLIWSARARGVEYPWRILKWLFVLTAIALCTRPVLFVAEELRGVLEPEVVVIMAMTAVPVCLQVVLLWWPRSREHARISESG